MRFNYIKGQFMNKEIQTKIGIIMKIAAFTFLCFFLNILPLNAQPDIEWSKSFGGNEFEWGHYAAQTPDGGYIAVGRTNSFGFGHFDGWLIKTNSAGDTLWTKNYGDYYIDETYNLRVCSDGGFFIVGITTKFGMAGEAWIIRTDANGNMLWEKPYHGMQSGTADWDYLYDLCEVQGGYVLAGMSAKTGLYGPNYNGWIIKVDANGNEIWNKDYGTDFDDRLFSLAACSDGGFIAAGDRHLADGTDYGGWIVKFNSNGDTLWTTTVSSTEFDIFRCVEQCPDGSYIVSGETQSYGGNGWKGWLVKLHQNGTVLWNRTYHPGVIKAIDIVGNSYVVAGSASGTASGLDAWFMKTDLDGNIIWEKFVSDGIKFEIVESLVKNSDGSYIIAGQVEGPGVGDFYLAKLEGELTSLALPLTVCDNVSGTKQLLFGVHPNATDSIDVLLGEGDLPPFPPAGSFEARFILPKNGFDGSLSSYADYRYIDGIPFTDTIEYRLKYQGTTGADTMFFKWNFPNRVIGHLQDLVTGNVVNVLMIGSGEYALTNFGVLNQMKLTLIYQVVPVELISFTADAHSSNVTLNWTTATELNNLGFEVERRSLNGEFVNIGFIPGSGTTTELREYSFTDKNVQPGIYSYRLKQIDNGGEFKYSQVIDVKVGIPAEFSLSQNYPNPFNPVTKIDFNLPYDSKVSLNIYNLLGEKVAPVINSSMTAGNHSVDFNAAGLNSGVYFYRLDASGLNGKETFSEVKKMIVLK